MPDSGSTAPGQNLVTELKVTGHLMTLDAGLFCIVHHGGSGAAGGLPGVRLSLPPGAERRPGAVQISSFRPDGWLGGPSDAALVRVAQGPAQLLVTIYRAGEEQESPRLQVVRLGEGPGMPAPAAMPSPPARPGAAGSAPAMPKGAGVVAHLQRQGDVFAPFDTWIGERGGKRWVEGFAVLPPPGIGAGDIEYQALLGRDWLSPWTEGGQFCGSRGMALPLLGLRVRLRGDAAATHECQLSATFVDGSAVGPVGDGEPCEAESLAPLEAFHLVLRPRAPAVAAADKPKSRAPAAPRSKRR